MFRRMIHAENPPVHSGWYVTYVKEGQCQWSIVRSCGWYADGWDILLNNQDHIRVGDITSVTFQTVRSGQTHVTQFDTLPHAFAEQTRRGHDRDGLGPRRI
jgi:hypothetical protein